MAREMRAGDAVELRSPAEILATLDENGTTDGLPFMPEMLEHFGKTFRVENRVERACNTLGWGVKRLPSTVMLDDLRCSGKAHAGCQAGCRLYWKEEWLRPASGGGGDTATDEDREALAKLAEANTEAAESTAEEPVFRCQGTEWFKASEQVPWWDLRSLRREYSCGNVGLWKWTTMMVRIVFSEIGRRLRLIPRGGEPFLANDPEVGPPPTPSRWLEPGALVQIRSKNEIAPTVDAKGKTKGLWFDREMLPFCGKTFPIERRVERFVDEGTGKLVELKTDCYILDGVVCSGDRTEAKWFCRRAIYPWWREAWLRPLGEDGTTPATETGAVQRAPGSEA